MRGSTFIIICFLGIVLIAPKAYATPAQRTIRTFYKSYLNSRGDNRSLAPKPPFSASFQKLITENTDICRKKAGTDVCGWDADGDVFLDSQEVDPKLNYENSKIVITEPKPGTVKVKLDVFPSAKNAKVYAKTIVYKMIFENDQWVVDDIVTRGKSARRQMRSEIEFFQKK